MKNKLLMIVLATVLTTNLHAQSYTEIFEGGWGSGAYGSKPAFTDFDNDGLLDLVVGEYLGNLSHYEQSASNSRNFIFKKYISGLYEIGKFTSPCFADIDGNNRIDMLVGEQSGVINHFEQDAINSENFILISESFSGIFAGSGSNPTITDLDNNGLLDLLIGENEGNINHYQQDSLNSLSFSLVTDSLSGIDVGKWSTPFCLDINANGLIDLFIGNSSGIIYHYEQDTISSFNFNLISENFSSIIENSPITPTLTDIDNNGLIDLIYGDDDVFLNHYEQNNEYDTIFNFVTDKFILGAIDVGNSAVPCFVDLDNDGLLDMLVGEYDGFINHFEQDAFGSNTFNLLSENFSGITYGIYTSPVVVDLGNNDLLDLFVGNYNGNIAYYEQSIVKPDSFNLISNNFCEIDVGRSAAPVFTNLDSDDLMDLIIGNNDGTLTHYEQSSPGSTIFNFVVDTMSGIIIDRWIKPSFTDLDGDSLLDMIIGNYDGILNHYEQNTNGSAEFTFVTDNFQNVKIGDKIRPTFVDINMDGLEDLLVGQGDGGIHYYQQNIETSIDENLSSKNPMQVFELFQNYPNPFNPTTTISYSVPNVETGHIQYIRLTIYDMLGREVALLVNGKQKPGHYEIKWNASNITSGIYIYQLICNGAKKNKKLILLK